MKKLTIKTEFDNGWTYLKHGFIISYFHYEYVDKSVEYCKIQFKKYAKDYTI